MSRDDSDIIAVRDLPPGRPEPTDESVSRTWHRITTARRPGRTSTLSRILVPAVAATLVAGLVVGGALVLRPGGAPLGFGSPSADKSSDPNLTPASPETVAALNALADAAERGPAAAKVRPGQYIFVRHDGWAAGFQEPANKDGELGKAIVNPQIRELWFDPEGMITMALTDGVADMGGVDLARQRETFKEQGPNLMWPTPEWLAGLPTDPKRLRDKLRDLTRDGGSWSTDHALWDDLQEFYLRADLLLSPEVRAALLRSYTGLRGITSSDVTIDGRRLVAVRHTERDSGYEILFDPATGAAVGRRSVSENVDQIFSAPPGAPELDPGVGYQATWTQKVVDAVGAH